MKAYQKEYRTKNRETKNKVERPGLSNMQKNGTGREGCWRKRKMAAGCR